MQMYADVRKGSAASDHQYMDIHNILFSKLPNECKYNFHTFLNLKLAAESVIGLS